MNKIANIRGCNYLPMARTSHNLSLSLLPVRGVPASGFPTVGGDGFFDRTHLRSELDEMKRAGFNSIRLWGSFMGWYCDQTGYLACLQTLCDELLARQMGITYLMWNSTPAGYASLGAPLTGAQGILSGASYSPSTVLANLWTAAEAFQALPGAVQTPPNERYASHWQEPCSSSEWDTQGAYAAWPDTAFKAAVGAYITSIGRFFASDSAVQVLDAFDLYNECDTYFADATRKANVLTFIKATHDGLRAQFPNPIQCTVGFAGIGFTPDVLALGVPLTFVSFHNYQRALTAGAIVSERASVPSLPIVMMTEFYDTRVDSDGDLTTYMDALDAAGMPGYMWCYEQNNVYPTLDGIVKADRASKLIKLGERYGFTCVRPRDDARIRRWTGVTT